MEEDHLDLISSPGCANSLWMIAQPVVSSTETECIAIAATLKKPKSFKLEEVVILTDSKAALLLLQCRIPTKRVSVFLTACAKLGSKGFNVWFQWIPSHVGVMCNETADQMAWNALSFALT